MRNLKAIMLRITGMLRWKASSVFLAFAMSITGCATFQATRLMMGDGRLSKEDRRLVSAVLLDQKDEAIHALEDGANPNALDLENGPPVRVLDYAVSRNQFTVTKALLQSGADVDATSFTGATPLIGCAWKGHLEIAKLLIEAGADVNASDGFGRTPLIVSAQRNHLEIVAFLVNAGADLNVSDCVGRTPLIASAGSNHLEIVAFLVNAGADLTAEDIRGRNALDVALNKGHRQIADLLGVELGQSTRKRSIGKSGETNGKSGQPLTINSTISIPADPETE
jgi:ankyrin repeat protein